MKNTSTGGDFCCDFGWQKGAATTESSHLLHPTNVPNIPLKSFVFNPLIPLKCCCEKTKKKRRESCRKHPQPPYFFRQLCGCFGEYRVLNEARTSPNLQSKLEKHAPNVIYKVRRVRTEDSLIFLSYKCERRIVRRV
uniref:Uncharacterized protein n=1 Tax=Lactuca sativa TaxID=4236 RepID=A0A9R1WL70_LACSA|nr:hypothetical protein LSAT_V11C100002260 [Lactuca sativa]